MITENTDAQVKAQIIDRINIYKQEAIDLGFDFPTYPPTDEDTAQTLFNFLEEIVGYIAYNIGFNDGVEGEENTFTTDIVTH